MATFRQLQTFVAVAEYKKMSEAAKKLFISQPTVSQIISDLEEEYQVTLFERKPKELQITPAGSIMLTSAHEIIAIQEHLEQSMHNLKSKRPLRVGATLTIGNTLISSLVETLTSKYPDIDVTVFVDNTRTLEHRMIHNDLDVALVEGIILREEILVEPVLDDYLKLICGPDHPFWGRNSVTIEELSNQDFILREKGSGTRDIFENMMICNHIPYACKWECASGTSIMDAVQHNFGLGVLSRRCIKESVDKGMLHQFDIEGISMKRFFYICHNQKHPVTSQMKDFITIAKTMGDE